MSEQAKQQSRSSDQVDDDSVVTTQSDSTPEQQPAAETVAPTGVARPPDDTDATVMPDRTATAATALDQQLHTLERTVSEQREQLDALQTECLRAHADAENYRKRIAREKAQAIEFANSRLLLDIVTVLDNFERALNAVEKTEFNASLFDGVLLIKKEWVSMLENNWGVREIQSIDQTFDPQLHEAVAIDEDASATKEYVSEEFQKGYWLHARVLRPAKVKVIKPTDRKNNTTG